MKEMKIYETIFKFGENSLEYMKNFFDKKFFNFFMCSYLPGLFKAYSGFSNLIENFGLGST